jgi:hypothetical protein
MDNIVANEVVELSKGFKVALHQPNNAETTVATVALSNVLRPQMRREPSPICQVRDHFGRQLPWTVLWQMKWLSSVQ